MPRVILTADECRVLGTLVEKAQTTPGQYPLTLNALVLGCNQKNNRDPVTNLTEDHVLEAIDGLRSKGLVREAMLSGSRVNKYRHIAREALAVSTAELVALSELMLRGPQAPGEIRGHASRMMPPGDESLATLENAVRLLDALGAREEPLVRRLPRRPGERAERYVQLLCPDLHPLDGPVPASDEPFSSPRGAGSNIKDLEARVESLEAEMRRVKDALSTLGAM